MKNNKQNIIIVLFVIIIVAMIGGFVFYYLKQNETSNNDNPNQTEDNKDILTTVYLDPTDLKKVCTAEDVSKNVGSDGNPNGIKTGCMKWYIYGKKDTFYTMILAHNTVRNAENTSCNSQASKVTQPGEEALQELVNIYNWKVTPRLITLEEIDIINPLKTEELPGMGTVYFVEKNAKSNWVLENLNNAEPSDDASKSYNYIIYSTSNKSYKTLDYNGKINSILSCDQYAGVRPVIEVSKSIIDNK